MLRRTATLSSVVFANIKYNNFFVVVSFVLSCVNSPLSRFFLCSVCVLWHHDFCFVVLSVGVLSIVSLSLLSLLITLTLRYAKFATPVFSVIRCSVWNSLECVLVSECVLLCVYLFWQQQNKKKKNKTATHFGVHLGPVQPESSISSLTIIISSALKNI